jgi:hypothetical protein
MEIDLFSFFIENNEIGGWLFKIEVFCTKIAECSFGYILMLWKVRSLCRLLDIKYLDPNSI